MTPDQEQRVLATLDTAELVINGCALRESDTGTKYRLYDEAKRIRELRVELTPPITVADIGIG